MNNEDIKFDYHKAVGELEQIAKKVEDPSTPITDIESYIKKSEEIISQCRAWLRGMRDKTMDL